MSASWEDWFAWHPVNVENEKTWVAFETVQRRAIAQRDGGSEIIDYKWEYRTK